MAGIPTANDSTETLDTLRRRWKFTDARLKGDPNGLPFIPSFTAFGATWAAADKTEMDTDDAVVEAEAGAVFADGTLDRLVDQVTIAIHGSKKVNVNLALHQLYFAGDSPSVFKKPVLGAQLLGMGKWPALLAAAVEPELLALAPQAATVVSAAAAAAKALGAAIAERDKFALGGGRKKVFDAYNALAATVYGGLKTFVHENPQLKLPAGYAESFFLHVVGAAQPKTLGEANALVTRLEQKLGRAKKVQGDLAAKEAAHAAAVKVHKDAVAAEVAAKKAMEEAKKAAREAAKEAKKVKPKKV